MQYSNTFANSNTVSPAFHYYCVFVFFRTLTGLGMLVCSMDGTVAYLDFSLDELGDPLSEEEKVRPSLAVKKTRTIQLS